MCERANLQRLTQMGQDGWSEEITEETSSFSFTEESVVKHTDTSERTLLRTHNSNIPPHSHRDVFISLGNFERIKKKMKLGKLLRPKEENE